MRRKDREITDEEAIEEIVKSCKICHVSMADGGEPYVVPLSFGYERQGRKLTLYFHSAREGRKLDILHKNHRVCFEMALEGKPVHAKTPCPFHADETPDRAGSTVCGRTGKECLCL